MRGDSDINRRSGRFEGLWLSAVHERTPDPYGATGQLVSAIAEVVNAELVDYGQIGSAALFLMDLSSLGFGGLDLNVVVATHTPQSPDESRQIAKMIDDYRFAVRSVGFCFHITLESSGVPANQDALDDFEVIKISGQDLRRLFSATVPSGVIYEIIRRHAGIEQLCPFNTTREARGSMFVGRRLQLRRLTNEWHTSFLVSGARRIGKTSLLIKSYDSIRVRPGFKDRVFYFDCTRWGDYADCAHRIAHAVSLPKELRIAQGPRNLSYLLERASAKGHHALCFFLDEFDRVCETDQSRGWPLVGVLREAVSYQYLKVVFAGYRSVARLQNLNTLSRGSPFFGALEDLALSPLSVEELRALLCDPFRRLGIHVQDQERVVSRVYSSTAGYPFLVQFYGERLYRLAVSRAIPEVRPEDCESVSRSFELTDFLLDHFLQNTVGSSFIQTLERACVYHFSSSLSLDGWSEGDFLQACKESGLPADASEVHSALRNLCHASIFTFTDRRYQLTFPVLGEIIRESYPRLDLLLRGS